MNFSVQPVDTQYIPVKMSNTPVRQISFSIICILWNHPNLHTDDVLFYLNLTTEVVDHLLFKFFFHFKLIYFLLKDNYIIFLFSVKLNMNQS